jgi:hypothetical protein
MIVSLLCINYYNRCHSNAVNRILGLMVCITYHKITASYVWLPTDITYSFLSVCSY